MNNIEKLTLAEMEDFTTSNGQVSWTVIKGEPVYGLIERVLKGQSYSRLSKGQKGIVRRFLSKVTGLSRAQMTRLIQRWMDTRRIERKPARHPSFPRRYTAADIAVLAEVYAVHEDLSDPAVRHLCKRGLKFGEKKFERLANISASHIYNLRRSTAYRNIRVRVDTVHQGQHDGRPGVYHINAVDTVTQWQVVGCVETIGEQHLISVLEAMLHQFPFRILGFHCDNGSEFLNKNVVRLPDLTGSIIISGSFLNWKMLQVQFQLPGML